MICFFGIEYIDYVADFENFVDVTFERLRDKYDNNLNGAISDQS